MPNKCIYKVITCLTNVYILYCDYVLCIRPEIKYLFCSVPNIDYNIY